MLQEFTESHRCVQPLSAARPESFYSSCESHSEGIRWLSDLEQRAVDVCLLGKKYFSEKRGRSKAMFILSQRLSSASVKTKNRISEDIVFFFNEQRMTLKA